MQESEVVAASELHCGEKSLTAGLQNMMGLLGSEVTVSFRKAGAARALADCALAEASVSAETAAMQQAWRPLGTDMKRSALITAILPRPLCSSFHSIDKKKKKQWVPVRVGQSRISSH